MREYRGAEIRNIAVVGHGASGKTSLDCRASLMHVKTTALAV